MYSVLNQLVQKSELHNAQWCRAVARSFGNREANEAANHARVFLEPCVFCRRSRSAETIWPRAFRTIRTGVGMLQHSWQGYIGQCD